MSTILFPFLRLWAFSSRSKAPPAWYFQFRKALQSLCFLVCHVLNLMLLTALSLSHKKRILTVFIFEIDKIRIELSFRYDIYELKENLMVER